MQFTQQQSIALNVIRVLSVILIFSCHILQGLNNRCAWVLNVGVQVFFFLSGFLYGTKGVGNIKDFYSKRFLKIYIPYFVTVTIVALFMLGISPQSLSGIELAGHYLCLTGILTLPLPGLQHLWFIPVIFSAMRCCQHLNF